MAGSWDPTAGEISARVTAHEADARECRVDTAEIVRDARVLLTRNEALIAAARRMLPAAGYLTDDMPDEEPINLVTTAGAARQLIAAVAASGGATPGTGDTKVGRVDQKQGVSA